MNVAQLILELKSKINSCTADQQYLSKAIKLLEVGAVYSVSSVSALPVASAENAGQLYYADYDGLYWSTGTNWLPIVQNFLGSVWAWGLGTAGVLGTGFSNNCNSPVSVVGGFNNWCQISAGQYHNVAVRQNGTLWAWGCNAQGRLGDNTISDQASPVSVVGGYTDWCQVSAGCDFNVALRTNGTAWSWGRNVQGKLGDGTTISTSSPVAVIGGYTDWCQVSSGSEFTIALRSNGTAWAWGNNNRGVLGNGGVGADSCSPVSVVGGFTDWSKVSAGDRHAIGLRSNGTLWSWGDNYGGRLGDGTTTSRNSPVSVVGGFTDWCQADAGRYHSLGVRTNGTAWAWGCNLCGMLGDYTTIDKSSPVSVVGGYTDWCQVSAGWCHSHGIRTNGTLWAWGLASCGRFGTGTLCVNRSSPVAVCGGFTDWYCVTIGGNHSIGLRKTDL